MRSKKTLTQWARNFVTKTKVLGTAHSENFVIACTGLIGLQSVTDGQTNGQTDRRQKL